MPLESIDEFEDLNNLAINVFGVEDMKIIPIRTSVREGARDSIDLLLVEEGDRRHYALIKNLHKLLMPAAVEKSDPLRESAHIPLPSWIVNKRAVQNIKNSDDEW